MFVAEGIPTEKVVIIKLEMLSMRRSLPCNMFDKVPFPFFKLSDSVEQLKILKI